MVTGVLSVHSDGRGRAAVGSVRSTRGQRHRRAPRVERHERMLPCRGAGGPARVQRVGGCTRAGSVACRMMRVVNADEEKAVLHDYLRTGRADLLSKLDGLGEYDVRRPLTPTGTSLLGLVKHLATVELGYFGEVFGRPADRVLPWFAADADATIQALPLDAPGQVPWWPPERRQVSLHQILVHMCVETARHAGHADILRDLLDGTAGRRPGDPSMPERTADQWAAYHAQVENAAQQAAHRTVDGPAAGR